MKIFLIIALFSYSLFASIEFKETRYMAALDFDKERHGVLDITDKLLILKYQEPSVETITYSQTKISIKTDDDLKEYTFKEYPQAEYMGLILRTIINENYNSLDNMFEVTKNKDEVILTSLPIISNMVEYIEIKKTNKLKKTIILFMTNSDKITIETYN